MMQYEPLAIDRHFADFICREAVDAPPWLGSLVSLLSTSVGNAAVCLSLPDIAGTAMTTGGEDSAFPHLEQLKAGLQATKVVGAPGDFSPLVLDSAGRLYLYRYWQYEHDLAQVIREKSANAGEVVDETLLAAGLARLFPGSAGVEPDLQMTAAMTALRKKFCVISGGPGTGKTSTVVKIIALLLEQANGAPHRIALAAPTGKSAARLNESIRAMKEKLDCSPAIREQIPDAVTTLHRLLGARGGSVRFRHCADNPLPFDTVIVDEASMVALPLMAKLAVALKHDARLILLGDKDQLASVEAGAVLGDICGEGGSDSDYLVVLTKNYRFGADSGIGELSMAVNGGDGMHAVSLLAEGSRRGIAWRALPEPGSLGTALSDAVVAGYAAYLAAGTPAEALELFNRFRILCAVRKGPYGVEGVNDTIEQLLARKRLIDNRSRWYGKRPVMITENNYALQLFNGDVGIVFPDPDAAGEPRVFFPATDGGVRKISPARLPAHETVYAMTVHKSQGSEFDSLLMLLPPASGELLTRELVYTGLTRARKSVELWGDQNAFIAAVARRVERRSGLRDALSLSVPV